LGAPVDVTDPCMWPKRLAIGYAKTGSLLRCRIAIWRQDRLTRLRSLLTAQTVLRRDGTVKAHDWFDFSHAW